MVIFCRFANTDNHLERKFDMKRRLLLFIPLIGILLVFASPGSAAETFASVCAEGLTLENPTPTEECQQIMLSFPVPVVTEIPEDRFTLSNYEFWRVMGDAPNLYDGPAGNIVESFESGIATNCFQQLIA